MSNDIYLVRKQRLQARLKTVNDKINSRIRLWIALEAEKLKEMQDGVEQQLIELEDEANRLENELQKERKGD